MVLRTLVTVMLAFAVVGAAEAQTRTLKFYNVHTKERAKIVYKKNGRYLSGGLKKVNWILRDWRRKEPTKMDPRLLDLVWEVYRKSGSRDYIHIISGYRSPATNAMLRRKRGGQARKSQHMLGKALDFYLPDVSVRKLRNLGLKMHVGGVGYYPKSGSPFVHLDVGGVRHWPRMSRKQLMAVFPDGKSLHIPRDGKPLPKYKQAMASYNKRKKSGGSIVIASTGDSSSEKPRANLLSALFGGGADEEEETSTQFESRPKRATTRAAEPEKPKKPAETDKPETLLAALPIRKIPVPAFAPRRAPADAPAAESLPGVAPQADTALPQPAAPQPVASPAAPAADLPLPGVPRVPVPGAPVPPAAIPGSVPPSADVPVAEQNAPVAVAALVPVPTLRPTYVPNDGRLPQTDLAVLSALQARDMVALARVDDREAQAAAIRAAVAASSGQATNVSPITTAGLPVPIARPGDTSGTVTGGIPVPLVAERPADQAPPVQVAALGDDIETIIRESATAAPKRPRARAIDAEAAVPKARAVPIEPDVRRWAIHGKNVTSGKSGRLAKAEARRQIRTAPTSVIAQGFVQAPQPDAYRFSGKAVTFLTVARFDTATN